MRVSAIGKVVFCLALLSGFAAVSGGDAKSYPEGKDASHAKGHIIRPDEVKFGPGPTSLPAGAEVAALDGDMKKEGSEFTVRLRVPDGWIVPAHFHPKDEHVTVIEGNFAMGLGDKFDEAALTDMPAGSYHAIPKGVHHFGKAKGRTVLQLNGVGAWGITYVNPADDPSRASAGK